MTLLPQPITIGGQPEDDDDLRRLRSVPIVADMKSAAPAPTPVQPTPIVPTNAPIKQPTPLGAKLDTDQSELKRLEQSGSGLDQYSKQPGIGHKILSVLGRIGDVAGTAMFPGVTEMIPGTTLHHNMLVGQAGNRVAGDLGQQKKQSDIEHEQAETKNLDNPPDKQGQEGKTVETGEGVFQWNPETSRYDIKVGAGKSKGTTQHIATDQGFFKVNEDGTLSPLTYNGQPVKPSAKENFEEQSFDEWKKANPNGTRMDFEAARSRNSQKPEKEPHQLAVGPDGTVIDLKPGMKVQAGTKTAAKYGEPTADEQRRADLAGNLKENLDKLDDIVTRRPELFGPAAGRFTSWRAALGTGDPDIAALETIKHQIGMAQISAHGMRSAQGIGAAAESIMNGFHNTPEAVKGAIKAARDSVGTFERDVAKAKGEQSGGEAVEEYVRDPKTGKLVKK